MDMYLRPTEPDKIKLTLSMVATVAEWQELMDAIMAGADLAKPPKEHAYLREPEHPESVKAAVRLAKSIGNMVEHARKRWDEQKEVTPWRVQEPEPPAPPAPPPPPTLADILAAVRELVAEQKRAAN
jgi:hypothetical protein